MLDHWQRLELRFDAVYSGFLASPAQMDIVERCILQHLTPGGLAVIDPVLGDNGKLDPTMTLEMVDRMRWLITRADVITPNFTEAAFLLDEPCRANISSKELSVWIRRLCDLGPRVVVITSVPLADRPNHSAVFAGQRDSDHIWKVECPFIPAHYPGTGDTFASVLLGSLLQGDSVPFGIDRAVQFVTLGIRATFGHNLPPREGILLERILDTLRAPVTANTYEVLEV
jgi:pyridoxine kinase